MPEDSPAEPQPDEPIRLTEPTEREAVELAEDFRKGTDPFPVVNVSSDEVTPSLSADPPPNVQQSADHEDQ